MTFRRHLTDRYPRRPVPRARQQLSLGPLLGPFLVPANCAVSATPPSRTSVRVDRSVVACRRAGTRRVFSKGPLPHQHAIDATHFEASSCRGAVAMMHSLDAVEGKAVGWAVLLVSTSVEVCGARERARGLETRRSLKLACRELCRAARRCQRCLRARFGRILAAMRFWRFSPRAGVCFAAGLARCGCGEPCLGCCRFRVVRRSFDPRCTGQFGKLAGQLRNHGFFLLPIQMTPNLNSFRLPSNHKHARTDHSQE